MGRSETSPLCLTTSSSEASSAGYFTDPELARACQREAFSRGPITGYLLAIRRTSGQLAYLLCSAAAYRDGQNQAAGVVVIAHDVSQQKQREDELARLHADMMLHTAELKQRESEIERINDLYEVLQACNSQQEAYPVIGSVAAQLFPKTSGALAVSVSRAHQMETAVEWGTEPRMATSFLLDDCWALRRGQMQEVAGRWRAAKLPSLSVRSPRSLYLPPAIGARGLAGPVKSAQRARRIPGAATTPVTHYLG